MDAPLGTMIIQITYRMEDDRFDTGYVLTCREGEIVVFKRQGYE